MESLEQRIAAVRARIAAAARRAGRPPEAVRLVAVTKGHPPELVRAALAAGLAEFGENRVQEAEAKIAALADPRARITWHLIGHLQTNKAKKAAALFDIIHSVDSLRLAEILAKFLMQRAEFTAGNHAPVTPPTAHRSPPPHPGTLHSELGTPILLQVNVSGEATKEGFDLAAWETRPAARDAFLADVERIIRLPGLQVRGLMTIAPWGPDPEAARPVFAATRRLRDQLAARFPQTDWRELSMGMTDDFEVAIEEGATIVRIGRALFGER